MSENTQLAVMPLKHYKYACDKIREKTGEEDTITSGHLGMYVDLVYGSGQYAGKKSEYDRFWDTYQRNGNRNDYPNSYGAFSGYSFNFDNFYPKYDICPEGNAMQFFMLGQKIRGIL